MGYQATADGFNPKFTGQMRDGETGLYYLRARYYSPAQGRFTGADPENAGARMGDPQSWNGYAYVGNDPLNYTDPTGEGIFGLIGGIVGRIFGGALGTSYRAFPVECWRPQSQFDSLASFTFNVGGAALNDSTLLDNINGGKTVEEGPH